MPASYRRQRQRLARVKYEAGAVRRRLHYEPLNHRPASSSTAQGAARRLTLGEDLQPVATVEHGARCYRCSRRTGSTPSCVWTPSPRGTSALGRPGVDQCEVRAHARRAPGRAGQGRVRGRGDRPCSRGRRPPGSPVAGPSARTAGTWCAVCVCARSTPPSRPTTPLTPPPRGSRRVRESSEGEQPVQERLVERRGLLQGHELVEERGLQKKKRTRAPPRASRPRTGKDTKNRQELRGEWGAGMRQGQRRGVVVRRRSRGTQGRHPRGDDLPT
ncbi:hypothetical protein QJS66_21000 [Kocuria rhizophila]|nr:hypothetical protein QJS66_21000 [Kocuria rhizophila]